MSAGLNYSISSRICRYPSSDEEMVMVRLWITTSTTWTTFSMPVSDGRMSQMAFFSYILDFRSVWDVVVTMTIS